MSEDVPRQKASQEASLERENDAAGVIPVGNHTLPVSAAFVASYERAIHPLVMAQRVWIERRGGDLILHVGRCFVAEGASHREARGASVT
jgi:hypothetical protein